MIPNTDTLLNIENLTVSFKKKKSIHTVVHNFSLSVPYNHIVGIVGESGSGKSISMLALLGLLPNHASKKVAAIHWKQKDIASLSKQELRTYCGKDFAYIYQEPSQAYDPLYTIYKTFRECYLAHSPTVSNDIIHKNTIALLQEVGIDQAEERLHSYFHQFSGGMIQRVQIALALVHNPSLLIADEITTALDVTTQKKIIELLLYTKKQHAMSMIFISHDIALIASIADSIVVMNNGSIAEYGTTQQIIKQPQHAYTQQLLSSTISFGERHTKTYQHTHKKDGTKR